VSHTLWPSGSPCRKEKCCGKFGKGGQIRRFRLSAEEFCIWGSLRDKVYDTHVLPASLT